MWEGWREGGFRGERALPWNPKAPPLPAREGAETSRTRQSGGPNVKFHEDRGPTEDSVWSHPTTVARHSRPK